MTHSCGTNSLGKAFNVSIDKNIALLTFDLEGEKVNKISTRVGEELEKVIQGLQSQKDLKGLILISGKPDVFIAGADIEEILSIHSEEEGKEKSTSAQRLPNLLESLPFPTVAAIHGACLGGGLELVLGCTYRVASDNPKTKIGLPEVSLGVLPGMGGCNRLPRLIGLTQALDMILAGKVWPAIKCLKVGLVDEVVPSEILVNRAVLVLEKGLWKKKKQKFSLMGFLLEKNRLGRHLIYKKAKQGILQKTRGHYPAPLKALDVIYECLDRGLTDGLKIEAEGFGELSHTKVSKNLIELFFQSEAAKKKTGIQNPSVKPKKIFRAAVIGAGAMGAGIAQLLSHKNIAVRLKDINEKAVAQGLTSIRKVYQELLIKKQLTSRELDQAMALIGPTTEFYGFKNANIVIEAIVEDLAIKQKLFQVLESQVSQDAILATNTSSLSIADIRAHCQKKERVIGMHFFNPVHRMPLVEIIIDPLTSDSTVVTTVDLAKQMGKVPVVVKNSPGFLVNRILMPYMNEAAYLLEEGVTISQIDEVMLDFGMPMGPFTLLDAVGIDVAQKVAHILHNAFGDRLKPNTILDRVVQAGYLGKKNKKGFYQMDGKRGKENTSIYSVIDVKPKDAAYISDEWENRMVFQMINEGFLCLEEKIIEDVRDLDMAMIFGIGFPPFRGGLMRYAHDLGAEKVLSELEILHRRYGERFKPAAYLKTLIQTGRKIYD